MKPTLVKLTFDDLNNRYEEMTATVRCKCTVATPLIGGQPATPEGLAAFVRHHLGITDAKEAAAAVQRIQQEELGTSDIAPGTGELTEKKVYGVNSLRRTRLGPYLADWMLKACSKQAASRLGIFTDMRGSKGDFAEAGRFTAWGASLKDKNDPRKIFFKLSEDTYFQEFMGRVSSPKGSVSIIHHSECVPSGTEFAFEWHFLSGKLKADDVRDVLAMMMVCGLGSVRSLENGKFRIDTAEISMAHAPRQKPAKNKSGELAAMAKAS